MVTKMEQFEKCWGIQCAFPVFIKENETVCRRVAEDTWKAALEWALSHKKPIKYNDYKFDYIKTDVIEAELLCN